MSIKFQVIDLGCEQSNPTFFTPQVALITVSTTTFATVRGYSEFGTPSSPPKKYRKATLTGISSRVGYTAESTPQQAAGGKYVFSGVGEIDFNGNPVSSYQKNFYAQCAKQYWPVEPLQTNPYCIPTGLGFPTFVGYCWPADLNSCPVCDPDPTHWPFLGNKAVAVPGDIGNDLQAFTLSSALAPTVTKTSWSVDEVFQAMTELGIDRHYTFNPSGPLYSVSVGIITLNGQEVTTTPSPLIFPAVLIEGFIGQYIIWTDTNQYSAVLSEEYTDAQALAHAQVVVGTSPIARNSPRTTGFTSVTAAVVFTLHCVNLIVGRSYTLTVEFLEKPSNVTTVKNYDFTAGDIFYDVTDNVPTPKAGSTVTVQKPKIHLVPL